MVIEDLTRRIKNALSDDLRRTEYKGKRNVLAGHCYIASEAMWHLWAKSKGYRAYVMRWEGASHWYLSNGKSVIDLTVALILEKYP